MTVIEKPEEGTVDLVVEGAVAGGRCLARLEGKVVLVAGALPGERVRVRLTRDEKRYAHAEVVEVLEPHERRRTPPCPYAGECGGCDFQHAEPSLQLEMKREIVVDAYRRIGRIDVTELLEAPTESGEEFRTRRRIRLSFDPTGHPGLLRRGSHDVVTIEDCLQMEASFSEVILPWLSLAPPWRRAGVRLDSDGQAVVLFETGSPPNEKDRRRLAKITKEMERPRQIQGLLADGIPIAGKRELAFQVAGRALRADAASFFQGSSVGTEELVRLVTECAGGDRDETLLDLYAGVGLFAVCVGSKFARVIAAESDGRAARHLKHNLRKHQIRAEVHADSVEQTLRNLAPGTRETVIIDPPRVGLTKQARALLLERKPARVVSVSCDAATGARDTAAFVAAGWTLRRLALVNMFPTTAHIETVALLERGAGPDATSA